MSSPSTNQSALSAPIYSASPVVDSSISSSSSTPNSPNPTNKYYYYNNTYNTPTNNNTYSNSINTVGTSNFLHSSVSSGSGEGSASSSNSPFLDYREIQFEEIKLDDMPIGSGAFGVVYKGTWRGATVAVKKLLVVMDEQLLRDEIRREASVIQRVANHPNIVRFYGACTKNNPFCLVISLYPRGSVHSLLKSKTINLEWRTIVGFARDAAAGILHLHCENVIHRDIAARNLLVDDKWTVRISDFGLARIKVSATSSTKSNVGPVKWMAPEALKQKQYSIKSDSYSFGILLWELLTRKEPYEEMDTIQVALAVLDGMRPPIPEYAPLPYADLMSRCWSANPDQRPDFPEIMTILQKFYDALAPVADPVVPQSQASSPLSLTASQLFFSGGGGSSPSLHSSSITSGRELECPICGEVFDTVVETPCCHACYCLSCITDWGKKAGNCPECRSILKLAELRPNVPLQRLVDNMPVECPNSKVGCADRITRGILAEHAQRCEYAMVECGGYAQCIGGEGGSGSLPPNTVPCESMIKRELAAHRKNTCPFRLVGCPDGCEEEIRFCLLELHRNICPEVIVPCPHGCGASIRRCVVQPHCVNDCSLQPVPCKYAKWGCTAMMPRQATAPHYEENTALHLEMAEAYIHNKKIYYKGRQEELYQRCAQMQQENNQLRLSIEDLSSLKPQLLYSPLNNRPLVLPSCLVLPMENPEAMSLVALESDQRTIQYVQSQKFFKSVTSLSKAITLKSDKPIPAMTNGVYYFEISLKGMGKDGAIGIGLAAGATDVLAMPGWYAYTFGYHGDDGRKFGVPHHRFGMLYGPEWSKDDVVGCGWEQSSQKLFFTLNGKFLGTAFDNVAGTYYPAIGLHTPGARVKVNYGQEPFLFDATTFSNFAAQEASSS